MAKTATPKVAAVNATRTTTVATLQPNAVTTDQLTAPAVSPISALVHRSRLLT